MFVLQHFFFIFLRPAVLRLSSAQHSRLLLPLCSSLIAIGLFLLHFLGELKSQFVGECWWAVSSGGQILHLKEEMSLVGFEYQTHVCDVTWGREGV